MEEKARWVEYFIQRLQFSGYDTRYKVVTQALKRYDKRVAKYEQTGTMYPLKTEEEKEKAKRKKKEWYARGGRFESVMYVGASPGGQLKKDIQRLANRFDVKIKVVEKVSSTVKQILQKSDPFEKQHCGRNDCEVCRRGNFRDCKTCGCVYELACIECDRRYRGTTSRSVYERIGEEIRAWRNKEEDSPLWKHAQLHHGDGDFEMDIKVLSQCFGKPSRARITEAVMIEDLPEDKTMNSRGEWSYIKLSKVGRK